MSLMLINLLVLARAGRSGPGVRAPNFYYNFAKDSSDGPDFVSCFFEQIDFTQ